MTLRSGTWARYEQWRRSHVPWVVPGWAPRPPDFVGVGVTKAGTTWWFNAIRDHPRFASRHHVKELRFFDRFERRPLTERDEVVYRRYFARPRGTFTGEWTPRYVLDALPLLHRVAPDARLLRLLRDPIERYRSGVTMTRTLNRGSELPPRQVERQRALGCYADHLRAIGALFGRDKVLVLQHERCVLEPAAQLARTHVFLGVAPVPSRNLLRPHNVTRVDKAPLQPEERAQLLSLYEPQVSGLRGLTDAIDLALWPSFRHVAS